MGEERGPKITEFFAGAELAEKCEPHFCGVEDAIAIVPKPKNIKIFAKYIDLALFALSAAQKLDARGRRIIQ
jgi:hypothetical protein